MSSIPDHHVPVYKKLTTVRVYNKYFESKAIGAVYKLLVSRIWRLNLSDTRNQGYFAPLFLELARLYGDGKLAATYTDKELAEATMVTERHIRRTRIQLEKLGLLKFQKVGTRGNSYIYLLGDVLGNNDYGKYAEALYIRKWVREWDECKTTHGSVIESELPFASKIMEILAPNQTMKTTESDELGPVCPRSWSSMSKDSEDEGDDNTVQDSNSKDGRMPYNKNVVINTFGVLKLADQPGLGFDVGPSTVDLSAIHLDMAPTKFVSAIRKAHEEMGPGAVKKRLSTLAKEGTLTLRGGYRETLFYSTFFDAWMRKRGQVDVKTSTLVLCWWHLLAIDLDKPQFLRDTKKTRMILSKSKPLHHWGEFSYLLNTQMLNTNRGFDKLRGLEHVSWLVNWTNQIHWKLEEYRKQYVHVDDVDVLQARSAIKREQAEYDKKIESMIERLGSDQEETTDLDIDELLEMD